MRKQELSLKEMRNFIQRLFYILYLKGGTIEPEKEWDSDTLEEIGTLINEFGLTPEQAGDDIANIRQNLTHPAADARMQEFFRDPSVHYFAKEVLSKALDCDIVDAINDLEAVLALMKDRFKPHL